jgi:glycosyltransferase involved in cell wall biosynthesis
MDTGLDIIIPTFRDSVRAEKCIRHLLSSIDKCQGDVTMVVVDNEGDSALAEKLQDLPVTYLLEAKPGSYAARNTGLAATRSGIVAFTDSDCLPDAEWISRSKETLAIHGADISVGPVTIFPNKDKRPSGWEVIDMVFAFPIEERVRSGGWGVTANLVAARYCFETAGYFDDNLMSGGDAAWCRSATSKGLKLVYDPALIVRHPARATAAEHLTKIRRIAGGLVATARMQGNIKPIVKSAIVSVVPPVNKWRKVWMRSDICLESRLSALVCLSWTKWAYGFALLKAMIDSDALPERQ